MKRFVLVLTAVVACGLHAPVAEGAPPQTLEVRDLRVAFPEGSRIHVTGQLKITGLDHGENTIPGSVDVCVEYPDPEGEFALLPEFFIGRSEDAPPEEWLQGVGVYFRGQEAYPVRRKGPRIYNGTALPYPPLLDRPLDKQRDEGRWIPFDATQRFAGRAGDGARYRIVVEWRYEYLAGKVVHRYFHVVYGPFPWGEGPPCKEPLVARSRRPATFTDDGVKVVEPTGPVHVALRSLGPVAGEGGTGKLPVPKRSGRRPNQGEAADLCNALGERLGRWRTIAHASASANPRAANLSVQVAPQVPAADLAKLVARVTAEAAAALDWVHTVDVALRGPQGATQIGCRWDAIVAFAKGDTTLAAFHATWTVQGDAVPAPPKEE